jgi:hypothetical protein
MITSVTFVLDKPKKQKSSDEIQPKDVVLCDELASLLLVEQCQNKGTIGYKLLPEIK